MINALDFAVKMDDLQRTRFVEKAHPEELSSNQVLLEIDKFAFTSNNISYGVLGEQLHYWKFFPTGIDHGIIPAWGVAEVIVTNHPEIQVGQKFYGYYPMSTHLLMTVDKVSSKGFVDSTIHRQELPPIYNYYVNVAQDPAFTPDNEELVSIFRPLFGTSFLIDNYLVAKDFFQADQILVISASSKTAQALASQIAYNKEKRELNLSMIGLTSSKNQEFVQNLGWYDQVKSYNDIAHLNSGLKTIVVDFSGNHQLQYQLQNLFTDNLVYNCHVGFADWENMVGDSQLPKKAEFFFAPEHSEKLLKEWGPAKFQEKLGIAWHHFINDIQSKISIRRYVGAQELEQLYSKVLRGEIDPGHGNIVSLNQ